MHSRHLSALAVVLGLALVPAAASAAPRAITIDAAGAPQSWTGLGAPGLNVSFYETRLPNECGNAVENYCDDTLVHFTSAQPLEESDLHFRLEGFAHSDYDLRVYLSDATGAALEYLGSPTGDGTGLVPLETFNGDPESLHTFAEPDSYYLVRIVYFMTPGHENYTGKVSWTGTFDDGLPDDEG